MDTLLRLTIELTRLTRHNWTRGQVIVMLAAIALALAIVLIEWLGYWPEWMKAIGGRRGTLRR